jgi:hypothetical protein
MVLFSVISPVVNVDWRPGPNGAIAHKWCTNISVITRTRYIGILQNRHRTENASSSKLNNEDLFCLLYLIRSSYTLRCRGCFFILITLKTAGLLERVISSSQGLYLNTGKHKHRINTYTYQTSMPFVGFEPTIPASERAKTVHVLDRSATVTGNEDFPDLNSWLCRFAWHFKQHR